MSRKSTSLEVLMRPFSVRSLVLAALFAALLAVCSWISIPAAVPFTLQTFAVFLTLLLLPAREGILAIAVYLLLGAVGLPVFSGFRGGPSALFGPTGGYLTGFLLTGLVALIFEKLRWTSFPLRLCGLALGLLLCYTAGTVWFVVTYTAGPMTVGKALSLCVLPFLIPDGIKLALAALIARRTAPLIEKLR